MDEIIQEPPKKYLIQGLVADGEVSMLFGPPKTGKSFLALDLGTTLVKGNCMFADMFAVGQPVNVLYTTGEGLTGLQARLKGIADHHGLTKAERDRLKVMKYAPQLFIKGGDDDTKAFIAAVQREMGTFLNEGLLIIDTWARATVGADENAVKDVNIILSHLAVIQDELECSVLLIHHTNKNGELRGSSSIPAALDSILKVEKDGDKSVLSCDMAKDARKAPSIAYIIEGPDDAPYVTYTGTPTRTVPPQRTPKDRVLSTLPTQPESAMTVNDVAQKLGITAASVRKALQEVSLGGSLRTTQRQVKDTNGKPNRTAHHYYLMQN